MITIRRSTGAGLQEVERPAEGCWIDVTGPSADEAKQLAHDLNIPLVVGLVFKKKNWL